MDEMIVESVLRLKYKLGRKIDRRQEIKMHNYERPSKRITMISCLFKNQFFMKNLHAILSKIVYIWICNFLKKHIANTKMYYF